MKLHFNGPDALEVLKELFPEVWEKEIAFALHRLRVIKNFYKCDTATAVGKYLANYTSTAGKMLMLAAAHIMVKQESVNEALECVEMRIINLKIQLHELRQTDWSRKDKTTLRTFYNNRIRKYEQHKEILTLSAPVIRPIGIDYKSRVLR